MKLLPLDSLNVGIALDLLAEGFPRQAPEFWHRGLERAATCRLPDDEWPTGYLLEHRGLPQGVMLTFASRRPWRHEPLGRVVNLSSWFVRREHRGLAPMMLMRLMQRSGVTYTDLTPSAEVLQLMPRLNFARWNAGVMLAAWPFFAGALASCEVVGLDDLPTGALDPHEQQLLEDHAALGCLSGAYAYAAGWQPFVLQRTRYRGLPSAHLIYARSRQQALAHAGALAKFALRHGLLLLSMDILEQQCPRGAVFLPRGIKGISPLAEADCIDYAYSELVYLGLAPY